MTANPYVAAVDNGLGNTWAEGSTELTDIKGIVDDAVSDHDALATVFDTGGFALDVLGDIGDPLGAVINCAVGWIVDHVSFLREPVDWLAGNPDSIEAATTTWAQVSTGMNKDATTFGTLLSALSADTWSGDAADAYRKKAADWADALGHGGTMAELESALIAATGGLCAGFRGLIFNAISEAIERWVMVGLVALANSAWTFGASIAGWVIDVEIEAGLLAARIGAKIAELVEKAGRIAETLGRDGSRLERIGEKLVRLSETMMHDVRSTRSKLGWDRRYSNMDRDGQSVHDAEHLLTSLENSGDLLHRGIPKTIIGQGKNLAEVVKDPSADNVDQLAGGVTNEGVDRGVEWAKTLGEDDDH